MKELKNKTAFITGGGSGIGLGIARALLAADMNLVIADVHDQHLQQAREALGSTARTLFLQLDVTDRAAYVEAADAAEARFGNIHLLINNAGVALTGPIEQARYDDWDWMLGVNLGGVVNGIVTILPRILRHGEGGHVVNTASTSGLLPHAGAAVYCASKAAVIGMSEAMRAELGTRNVVVSVFCPGPVLSNIGNSTKARPESLSDTGYVEPSPASEHVSRLLRSPDGIGELVRRGIENDDLFILTHSEFRDGLAERAAAIARAIPAVPEDQDFKSTFAPILRNPAYGETPAGDAMDRSS